MRLEEVRKKLKDRRLDKIAEATDLCTATIARVRDGKGNPTWETVEKLIVYFENQREF